MSDVIDDVTEYERVVVDGRFIGFVSDHGRHGWFVQRLGSDRWTASRWGLTKEEAIEELKVKAAQS